MVTLDALVVATALPAIGHDLKVGVSDARLDHQRLRAHVCVRDRHRRRARRSARSPPGVLRRLGPVHRGIGGVRAGPNRRTPARRAGGAGTRGGGGDAAVADAPDRRLSARASRRSCRHLGRRRRAGSRLRTRDRRRDHPGHRLALDLLGQRTDRRGRGVPSPARASRSARASRPPGSARDGALERRGDRARVGAGALGRRRLGERRGAGRAGCRLRLLAGFVRWERAAEAPILPPALFESRTFSAANATAFL